MLITAIDLKTNKEFEKVFSNVRTGRRFILRARYGKRIYIKNVMFYDEEEMEDYYDIL